MLRKEFQLNEVIFRENEYQMWMYSICEGSVDLYAKYGTAEEKKLVALTAGQFFGEIGMIAAMPRTVTAVAADDHVVLDQISVEDLEDYLQNHPDYIQLLMGSVSRRLRELTMDFSEIVRMTNEALHAKGTAKAMGAYLSETIRKLLDSLKADKFSDADFAIARKRRKALSGEIPPFIRYCAGEVIFRAGDQSDCVYMIMDGRVGIYSDYGTNNEKLLSELGLEAVFGEMGLLDDMPRSASAVCIEDCCVQLIDKEHFQYYFRKHPMKMMQIMQQMCFRLRNLSKTYVEVCKTLGEIAPMDNQTVTSDLAWAKLEYFHESQLYSSMYKSSGCADWIYDCL